MPCRSVGAGEDLQTQIKPGAATAAFLQKIFCYRRDRGHVRARGEFPCEGVTRSCLCVRADEGIKAAGID